MDMLEIIAAKRDGKELSKKEIRYFVKGYTKGTIPDYQASALLMAIYLNGLTEEETFVLTDEMEHSGGTIDLSGISGVKVDKHSTGGVGDKVSLITGPVAAACGVSVAKMSGRGLGFTGGTIDKLESIPGFRTSMDEEEFFRQVNEIGLAIVSQTKEVAPADKKIYALRDVTSTVGNTSLIASSIMSKKLACGADAIVLDVKCGNGALMKAQEDAEALAGLMMKIGKYAGKRMVAVISDMDQPLGNAVGNAIEVREAIDVLKGKGPDDIAGLSIELAAQMVLAGGLALDIETAREQAWNALRDGLAYKKFEEMVRCQGGDVRVLEDQSLFAGAAYSVDICAETDGYVSAIRTEMVGQASRHAGAGRLAKDDEIDMGAGILIRHKIGDRISVGEPLMTILGNDEEKLASAVQYAKEAYVIGKEWPEKPKLIRKVLM